MNAISTVSFPNINKLSFKQGVNQDNSAKTPDMEYDSFQAAVKNEGKPTLFDKILIFFAFRNEKNPNKILKNNEKFIKNAEQKMNNAVADFSQISKNAADLYDMANQLFSETQNEDIIDNIRINSIRYKNSHYKAIAVLDENGFINKIIHSKDGKVHTVYDLKSPLKAGKERFYSGEANQKVTADCYFFDNNTDTDELKISYVKDVTNSILNFNAVYDLKNGGIKRVKKNSDNSPVDVFAKGIIGKHFDYWYNFGNKNEEKVSFSNDNDCIAIKYEKSKHLLGLDKLFFKKSYSVNSDNTKKNSYNFSVSSKRGIKKEINW